ncbi:MAG: PGN_0703 family putative restriction endonuclease, partial [Hyphomonadaceae bacterium]
SALLHRNLLVHHAEKIPPSQPLIFRGDYRPPFCYQVLRMTNSVSPRQLGERARAALRAALAGSAPDVAIDSKGYVADVRDNLIAGVNFTDIEDDFRQGDGGELEGKFRAAHSSSALAANTFAPFKRAPQELSLTNQVAFDALQFERKCPHGLAGRRPPNLDLVVEGSSGVIGVESKCLEHFSPHRAKFADAYTAQIHDDRRNGPWFAQMQAMLATPDLYRSLDAAQLVKHAFGLAHTFPGRRVHLLYIFWEPRNADAYAHFRDHRWETERFAAAVAGGVPSFSFMSYADLWRNWEQVAAPDWLGPHVVRLRARYDLDI